MEIYIQEGELLLDRYEWSGGHKIKPSINQKRWKLVEKGQAKIVTDFDQTKSKRKIVRKGQIR